MRKVAQGGYPTSAAIARANLDGTGVDRSFIPDIPPYNGLFGNALAVDDHHLYWDSYSDGGTIARANLDGTGIDADFILKPGKTKGPYALAVDALSPSNEFNFGKVKKNKGKGTAKLTVNVPGPGELDLAKTDRVKADEQSAEAAGGVKLIVISRGGARKKLNAEGKVEVNPRVTYTPTGGSPNSRRKQFKLIER